MSRPIVWTIAGSDNCSGAGIQADLKTFEATGVHGCTVIAALTAQNTQQVYQTESVSAEMLIAQMESLKSDMAPAAVKIGMLGDAAGVRAMAAQLRELNTYIVYDPVMIASAGANLMADDEFNAMKTELLPLVDLLTPNLAEAEKLSGIKIKNDADVERAAERILKFGAKASFIKGWRKDSYAQDYYSSADQQFWLTSPERTVPDARGTGCSLASICAATHALGWEAADAVTFAKLKINQWVRTARMIGKGAPILNYDAAPCAPEDMPWLTQTAAEGRARLRFPDCGKDLGFYPVVDSLAWLERLLPLGVTTAQLRIKNKSGVELENEIRAAIAFGKKYNCRLFINDYWQLAIKYSAYGVHLGQEDLMEGADVKAIADAGLRLGVSTHSYGELARALAVQPSYYALGPVYHTTLKSMRFAPQGLDKLREWRSMLSAPLVAIGGITLERAQGVLATGADSIAVVSDVTQNKDPEARTRAWLQLLNPEITSNFVALKVRSA